MLWQDSQFEHDDKGIIWQASIGIISDDPVDIGWIVISIDDVLYGADLFGSGSQQVVQFGLGKGWLIVAYDKVTNLIHAPVPRPDFWKNVSQNFLELICIVLISSICKA